MTTQTPDAVREALEKRKAINTALGQLLAPLVPDVVERIRIGNEACTAILAALDSRAGDAGEGWQSIETAPRDGTWFIADGGGLDRPTPMKWCERVGAWEADAVMLEDWGQQAEGYSRPLFWIAIPDRRSPTPAPAVDAPTTSTAIAAETDLPTDRYGMTVLDRIRDTAENGTMPPEDRKDLFALLDLAAAPKAASIPDDVREDIVCVRDTVTDDQWERLWVSLHGLKCNPVMDEITLVMQEVVAILCAPKAASAPAVDAVPAGEVDHAVSEDWEYWLKDAESILRSNGTTTHAYKIAEARAYLSAALSHGEGRK